jgi:Ca2+-binding RTX toxin-like protein
LYSRSGPDALVGGRGNDFLNNRSRGETLLGGPGRDHFDQMVATHQRRLDGGAGGDHLVFIGLPRRTPALGGPGRDSVRVILNDDAKASLDVGPGRVTQGGRALRVTSIDHWKLRAYDADLAILGTPRGDDIAARTRGSVAADLGAGNDRLRIELLGHRIDVRLGLGDDRVTVDREWDRPLLDRRFDGGRGVDRSHISGSGNTCVHIEAGTCPA